MNNKKKLAVVFAVLFVVCVFAVLVFSGVIGGSGGSREESTGDEDIYSSDSYMTDMTTLESTQQPYLPTNIDGIYYTASKDGEISFFKYENKAFTPVEATGTYTASVTLSEESVSADIAYYKDSAGQIAGYGLYKAQTGEYHLNTYAFFRLTNYGSRYDGRSSKSCLLLIDTTEDDFYKSEKIYEESFIFNYSDSSSSRSLSEANRTVGLSGAKRNDYILINDTAINNAVENQLFFSGRQYSEEDERVDLLRSGGSGNNTDNIRLAQDVLGCWVKQTDDAVMYLTTDGGDSVILAETSDGGSSNETVKTFDGVKRDDILVSGDYIYIISKNVVYSVNDDSELSLNFSGSSSFKADMFKAENGVFVVRGYIDGGYPTLVIANSDGSVKKSYTNEFFRSVVNPVVASDGAVILASENSGAFSTYIF